MEKNLCFPNMTEKDRTLDYRFISTVQLSATVVSTWALLGRTGKQWSEFTICSRATQTKNLKEK